LIYINSTFKKACRILHAYHLETLEVVDLIIDHEMSQYDFLIKKRVLVS